MRRILVFRGGALGDFILTIPALRLLKGRWPSSSIELVGNSRAAELGRREGLLDAIYSQNEARWAALYGTEPLPDALRGWLAQFDLIVCAWPDPEGQIGRHIAGLGPCCLFGAAQPAVAPAARHFCEILAPLGLATRDYRSTLRFAQHPVRSTTISLHPGSGSPKRNWPLERWAHLCKILRDKHPLMIVGGEADAQAFEHLAPYGEGVFGLPLPKLAQRLASCRCHVGHDTGITHLAAAVDTPCIALFGPSDPAMWAPPGGHVRVLRTGATMECIGLMEVFAEIERLIGTTNEPNVLS